MPDIINTEEHQTDEDAFEAAFASERGEEVTPAEEPATTEPEVPDVPIEPAADAPTEPAVPAEQPRLIAGLTEEQLQAALARNTSLQGTVDKMAGRLGQLMQQIEKLSAAPATPATSAALDLKLEKLGASFPELASLLREDLAAAALPSTPAEPVAPALAGITQEQLDARLASVTETTNEAIEVKVLSIMHPDWKKVITTPQFALWRDTVLPAGAGTKLMESQDASEISAGLTQFKEWAKPAPPPPAPPPRTTRLANAVLPNGGAAPAPVVELSEEAAFAASFANEQKRRGM